MGPWSFRIVSEIFRKSRVDSRPLHADMAYCSYRHTTDKYGVP